MSRSRALTVLLAGLLAAGCGGDDDGDRGGGPAGADGAPPASADGGPGEPDAGEAIEPASCDELAGTHVLERLDSHSNVCVDRATCTFTPDAAGDPAGEETGGCAGSITCEYQGAGVITTDIQFEPAGGGRLLARFDSGTRTHEMIVEAGAGGGWAYRVRGDLSDRHLCVFTDGATRPAFPVAGAGPCPDLTRTYRMSRLDPHLCSNTIRCGVFQHEDDACRADAFCTYPTGETDAFADLPVAVAADGASGVLVGDATEDPDYPTRYELEATGDFAGGAGAAGALAVDYYFNDPAEPTCQWRW